VNFRPFRQALLPLLLTGCGNGTSEAPKESSGLAESCKAAPAGYREQGLIQSHPLVVRAEVDDALWAPLSGDQKKEVLQALTCFAFEGGTPRGKEYAVIYGYDTGQRLAVMSKCGAEFDPVNLDERSKLPDFGP
jgi:hypothetical protein